MSLPTIEMVPQRRVARRPGVKPLIERRFPLHLGPTLLTVRELYEAGKKGRWDPDKHIPWKQFDSEAYAPETRRAAALSWSRRAWSEYTGIAETPAILIRFCLEHAGESDPKMFLTVRGSEEAWHLECAYRFAELLGGYVEVPPDSLFNNTLSLGLFRQAFDPALNPTAYIAAHIAILDGIDLELHRGYLRFATDPVAVSILRRMVQDKERHTAFGWVYLGEQAATWSPELRFEVQEEVEHIIRALVLNGYQCAALAPAHTASRVLEADAVTCAAGLGAMTSEEEIRVVRRYLDEARTRFRSFGVDIACQQHGVHGEF